MDADYKEKRREWGLQPPNIVERHDRFSMDPQRFEEILAEITTGYNNIRSSFENVNIAEILEEMVTEYARAALEAEAPPKFVELAVLLQHCAVLYGRKVDYLHQQVLEVAEALAAARPAAPLAQEGEEPASARRRRRASGGAAGFAHIAVPACAAAARAREPPRPPPTLPRMYIELEPRVPAPHEHPLRDDAGEPIGLPADYHVAGRLHDGYLVDELEAASGARAGALRPLSLLELQEALVAAAPPDLPPAPPALLSLPPPPSPPPLPSPPPSPVPPPTTPPTPEVTQAPQTLLTHRKRKSSVKLADIVDSPLKAFITKGLVRFARRAREFRPPAAWVAPLVACRARRLLAARRALAAPPARAPEFRGFEDEHPDAGGFPGWSGAEGAAARAAAGAGGASLRAADLESDDDGFFEGSSFSSIDSSRSTPPPRAAPPPALPAPAAEGDAAWSARVAAAAAAAEARGGVDVRALGRAVLRALPAAGAVPFAAVLRRAAAHRRDVSRLLLATLFLANSGNVHIEVAAPLAVGAFSVALVSRDERRYAAAAAAEPGLQPAAEPGLQPAAEPGLQPAAEPGLRRPAA